MKYVQYFDARSERRMMSKHDEKGSNGRDGEVEDHQGELMVGEDGLASDADRDEKETI